MSSRVQISAAVAERFPTYHGLVLLASGLTNGPSDARSLTFLREAEEHIDQMFATMPPEKHPHIVAWREAYRAFGVKPQRTLNSTEALIARAMKDGRLPAVNRIVDAYNAVSARCVVPCGGEDLSRVVGYVTLKVAGGTEPFETTKGGEAFVDYPRVGEVVRADEAGVTCRAWNWRQGSRTRLTKETTEAYFLFDALLPMTTQALEQAGDLLQAMLEELSPGCHVQRLRIGRVHELSKDQVSRPDLAHHSYL